MKTGTVLSGIGGQGNQTANWHSSEFQYCVFIYIFPSCMYNWVLDAKHAKLSIEVYFSSASIFGCYKEFLNCIVFLGVIRNFSIVFENKTKYFGKKPISWKRDGTINQSRWQSWNDNYFYIFVGLWYAISPNRASMTSMLHLCTIHITFEAVFKLIISDLR